MFARLRFLVLVLGAALVPAALHAQPTVRTAPAAGPRIDASASAMRPLASTDAASLQVRRSNSMGKPLSLIVVGGAAIVLGAVIGNEIGTLFMIGGAVALLYGLYLYTR